ncbi:type II toxin-antitoxin system VapB family antitoxin [Streptomyces sp. NPDC001107]
MSRTVIDLDDEALAEAARHLGTSTKKDTVNAALREIADRRRRAAAVERMRQMVAEGEIDFSVIEKPADAARTTPESASGAEHHAA